MDTHPSGDRLYSVTQLTTELDLTPRALRFYEAKGLLAPRRAGSTRVYSHRDRARLLIILRAKRLGFSLAQIKQYLDLYDMDPTQQSQLQLLLSGVTERIAQLEAQRKDLEIILQELRDIEKVTRDAMIIPGQSSQQRRTP